MPERKRQVNQVGGRRIHRHLRLTEAENAELTIAAQREGMSVQRFLVESATARVRGVAPEQVRETITALFGVQHHLAKTGNNLNQLARHANATGELLGRELADELASLRAALRSVDDVLEQVSLEARR